MKQFLVFLFACLLSGAYGQYNVPKFGKIDAEVLKMTSYEKDTSAAALILFDDGDSYFDLNNEGQFQYRYTRHYRIRIFKKSALDLSNVSFKLFESGAREELLTNLNAATYNLVEGKVVQTKLDRSTIFIEKGKNYSVKKFALPEVKEGSVIEVSYTIVSDFLYNFRGWNFQYQYPSLLSQYKFVIPEYFSYRPTIKGYLSFDISERDPGSQTYTVPVNLIVPTTENVLAVVNVPAFKAEPNIDCQENYIQSIEFELGSVQYPGEMRKDFVQSWESVNKEMIEDEDFGLLMKSDGFIKDTVIALCGSETDELKKAKSIFHYVQNRMEWNNRYSLWASTGLKKPFNERVGSSAEINLLLALMLKTAGLNADPVMFSTRSNGFAKTFYPTITKFNSVLVKLVAGEKTYMLDATNKLCPFGVLPPNDLNGTGRVVNRLNGDWAELVASERYKEAKTYELQISPEGIFSGRILGYYDGYAAIEYREALNEEKSEDEFIRKVQENLHGLTINQYSFSERNNIYKPLIDSFFVEINDRADVVGDKILFTPMLFEAMTKNRYTLEERNYPIDYNYLISEMYIFDYTIPPGYEVESIPENTSIKLADNSIVFIFAIQVNGNKIKVVHRRNINKILFLPEEYQPLKELYDQIVKAHTAQIILKKVA